MPRQATHQYTQETKIALLQKGQEYTNEKLDSIHSSVEELNHKLLGNGKPGLIAEQNKRIEDLERKWWKFAGALSVIITLITLFGPRIVNAILG